MTFSDNQLIQRAKNGDSKAIGELYLFHHEQIYRYVCARVLDSALAEDLTGEVFVRMVTRLSAFQDTGVPFQAWLYRIARNLVLDHFRKTNRTLTISLDQEGVETQMEENPAKVVEKQLTLARLKQALAQLDAEQAEVIRLRFMVGLPLKDTAVRLEKTVAAVKALQHRGVLALRGILQ